MTSLVRIADTFTNIRASFKIGPADLHTHASLVKRSNNKWLMLDSVSMQDQVKQDVLSMTGNGKDVEAILNLHPFHTVRTHTAALTSASEHVGHQARAFPLAKGPCLQHWHAQFSAWRLRELSAHLRAHYRMHVRIACISYCLARFVTLGASAAALLQPASTRC